MCFVWISEQTAIISLYSINWLVFIFEMEHVYCAVRTEYLYINQVNFGVRSVNKEENVPPEMRQSAQNCELRKMSCADYSTKIPDTNKIYKLYAWKFIFITSRLTSLQVSAARDHHQGADQSNAT